MLNVNLGTLERREEVCGWTWSPWGSGALLRWSTGLAVLQSEHPVLGISNAVVEAWEAATTHGGQRPAAAAYDRAFPGGPRHLEASEPYGCPSARKMLLAPNAVQLSANSLNLVLLRIVMSITTVTSLEQFYEIVSLSRGYARDPQENLHSVTTFPAIRPSDQGG